MQTNKVTIIAEAGVNHNGDISNAFKLIDAAVDAGVEFGRGAALGRQGLLDPRQHAGRRRPDHAGITQAQRGAVHGT